MPTQITVRSVSKSFDGRLVLDAVSCSLPAGERAGIIGENGSGKSTLLRLLAGIEQPDDGRVLVHAEGGIGHLAQDEQLPGQMSVQEVIDRALGDLRTIQERLRRLEAAMAGGDESCMDEYGRLATVFELRGGYEADARVERALHGLGLGRLERTRKVGALSGGQQVRLRLAAVLAAGPEVLLLDEPTNHLDQEALNWLEEYLRTRRGTTVVVSHDRLFLERVTSILLEVDTDRRALVRYGNGYTGYLAEKAAARRRWAQAHTQWHSDVEALQEAAATTARRVAPGRAMKDSNKMAYDRAAGRVQQSLASRLRQSEERLRRLLEQPVPPPPQPLQFTPTLEVTRAKGCILEVTRAAVTGRLTTTDLTVEAGQRLLITGPNGAGKTTLLNIMAGHLTPDTGHITRHGRIGHLPQEPPPPQPGLTLLDAFAAQRTGHHDQHSQLLLSLGLFTPEQLTLPTRALSTGQRRRLALARLLTQPFDALLLDEPTNHLSPALNEELETALAAYTGALVIVSHDRRLHQRFNGTRHTLTTSTLTPSD